MQAALEDIVMTFGNTILSSSLGAAELFVAALVACGLLMIAISALLPKNSDDSLEWWER